MNPATKNNPINKNEKGFSLLEVIFAMAIITSGILSIMSLFSSNLRAEENNKNKLIATYLAQEGIEVVRQARDNIWFGGDNDFLDNNSEFKDYNFIVGLNNVNDIRQGWEIAQSNANREKIYRLNDFYVQSKNNLGLTESGFTRYLEMADGSDGTRPAGCDINSCVEIISHVSFNGVESVKVTAYLYDGWYN
jgi:prepilin-type N-terminal cleavage/methylation domain-containing protein